MWKIFTETGRVGYGGAAVEWADVEYATDPARAHEAFLQAVGGLEDRGYAVVDRLPVAINDYLTELIVGLEERGANVDRVATLLRDDGAFAIVYVIAPSLGA